MNYYTPKEEQLAGEIAQEINVELTSAIPDSVTSTSGTAMYPGTPPPNIVASFPVITDDHSRPLQPAATSLSQILHQDFINWRKETYEEVRQGWQSLLFALGVCVLISFALEFYEWFQSLIVHLNHGGSSTMKQELQKGQHRRGKRSKDKPPVVEEIEEKTAESSSAVQVATDAALSRDESKEEDDMVITLTPKLLQRISHEISSDCKLVPPQNVILTPAATISRSFRQRQVNSTTTAAIFRPPTAQTTQEEDASASSSTFTTCLETSSTRAVATHATTTTDDIAPIQEVSVKPKSSKSKQATTEKSCAATLNPRIATDRESLATRADIETQTATDFAAPQVTADGEDAKSEDTPPGTLEADGDTSPVVDVSHQPMEPDNENVTRAAALPELSTAAAEKLEAEAEKSAAVVVAVDKSLVMATPKSPSDPEKEGNSEIATSFTVVECSLQASRTSHDDCAVGIMPITEDAPPPSTTQLSQFSVFIDASSQSIELDMEPDMAAGPPLPSTKAAVGALVPEDLQDEPEILSFPQEEVPPAVLLEEEEAAFVEPLRRNVSFSADTGGLREGLREGEGSANAAITSPIRMARKIPILDHSHSSATPPSQNYLDTSHSIDASGYSSAGVSVSSRRMNRLSALKKKQARAPRRVISVEADDDEDLRSDDDYESAESPSQVQAEEDSQSTHDFRRRSNVSTSFASDLPDADLECIAMALKHGLMFVKIKVKGRRYKQIYDDCFSGSAAVDFLCEYLGKPRAEAKQVGRRVAQKYNLFVKCGGSKKKEKRELEDGQEQESFHDASLNESTIADATGHDQEVGQHKRLKSSLLHDSGSIYYRMFAYLPSEVAKMPMAQKMKIFESGIRIKKHRRGRKVKKGFTGKQAVNFLVRVRLVVSREEGVELCNRFSAEFNLFEPLNRTESFQDSKRSLYCFVDNAHRLFAISDDFSTTLVELQGNDDWETIDDLGVSVLGVSSSHWSGGMYLSDSDEEKEKVDGAYEYQARDHQRLCEVAQILERGIKLKKKGTFAASRAVTFMVMTGLADSRRDAEVLGRRLERELNLFQEVTGKHDFSDSNHFFRFSDKHERHTCPLRSSKSLNEIAAALEKGVKVKDYIHNLKTYKQTFVGSKAVTFLVNVRLASSRLEAVRIGQQLVEQFNLFERVTGNREFCDDQEYFKFTSKDARKTPPAADAPVEPEKHTSAFLSPVTITPGELYELARWFLAGVIVKDNKFRAKAYRQTFVGSEAVSYLVNSSKAISRKEAVKLGSLLCNGLGLFRCIDGSTDFKDDYLLYRFTEQWTTETLDGVRNSHIGGIVSGIEGIHGVSAKSLPLEKVATAFRRNMKVSDLRSGMKTYKNSFWGREAVDFFVGHGLARDRVSAVDLGRALAREFKLFKHVGKQHEFKDAKYLYKFRCDVDEPIRPLEDIDIGKLKLSQIAKSFIANVSVKEHRKNLMVFKSSFVGSEGVDYLVNEGFASTRLEAVQIGRAITKEFNVFDHVTQDRKFEDSDALFYFEKEEDHYKGLLLTRQLAQRMLVDEDDLSFSFSNSSPVDADSEADINDSQRNCKVVLFEEKVKAALNPFRRRIEDDDDSMEANRKKRINRYLVWASTFRRLDPRYEIQHFFDSLGQDGAMSIESQDFVANELSLARMLLPSRAQFFTVWRPTSLHAIRRMMCGLAVGKGLDIKGKSAKRGKLSGFVPFLQIGTNKHKSKIRPPTKDGVIRVYYPGESRRARDLAAEFVERVAQEMIEAVAKARVVLADPNVIEEVRQDALETMLLDMHDPQILYLDHYAPHRYGFEIPERLFWEAYFIRQDCTRVPGSQYDTGRPSQPAFQDMNFAALRAKPAEDAPRACVYQYADPADPMNPFEMLMAYEEDGRVMPVVSDFDCFLVGSRGVNFTSSLAPSQMDVLAWYVSQIESVMSESKVGDSWTVRWLEVLKKAAREGRYPELPRFGFGDPKSYGIMKSSVGSLKLTGAVRHGSECFNFYFPQDLDDEYLIVTSGLQGNKPWLYVDQAGLLEFLMQQVDQGFTFPLNPKWVLCDGMKWYKLYQKLLNSKSKETQQSMNIWYPPDSGLRDQIERVHESRPGGFYQDQVDANEETTAVGGTHLSDGKNKEHLMSMFAMGLLDKPHISVEQSSGIGTDPVVLIEATARKGKGANKPRRKKMKKKIFGKKLQVIQE